MSNIDVFPAGNYMFKVNNRNTRPRCEICSKLTIKTPKRYHWGRSSVFIVNFEQISHLVLVFHFWLWAGKCHLGYAKKGSEKSVRAVHLNKDCSTNLSRYFPLHLDVYRSVSSKINFLYIQNLMICNLLEKKPYPFPKFRNRKITYRKRVCRNGKKEFIITFRDTQWHYWIEFVCFQCLLSYIYISLHLTQFVFRMLNVTGSVYMKKHIKQFFYLLKIENKMVAFHIYI